MALQRAALPRLGREIFGVTEERRLALLRAAWPGAVGPELRRRTEVVAFQGTTLRVKVPDSGWRKVLHRMQPAILARLEAVAGSLAPRRLGFVEGPIANAGAEATGSDRAPSPPGPSPGPASEALTEAAQAIGDLELRERFLEVAARYLDRQRSRP
jgi:hypothetical protein